jgi:hypothetical protein
VQASPSLHAALLFAKPQTPVCGSQLSFVQTLLSLQTVGVPGWHEPPPQISPDVHALPSSQAPVLAGKTHPEAGSHVSSVHTLPSPQTSAGPPLHAPPPQVSAVVHALPSSHADVLSTWTQPVAGLQLSSVHTFPSSQFGGGPPLQVPPPQVSAVVQAEPSSHAEALLAKPQAPVCGSQLSSVHTLLSLQTVGVPGWHEPPPQTSPEVHALPSSHAAALLT